MKNKGKIQNVHLESTPVMEAMTKLLTDSSFDGVITESQFGSLQRISTLSHTALLLSLLPYAAVFSHAPISKFNVGAIVQGGMGNLYFGANIEFLGGQLGQTVHAEQAAISNAWMHGETSIQSIAINYSPCGHCRQFMNELNQEEDMHIHLPPPQSTASSSRSRSRSRAGAAKTLKYYLPEDFGPRDLGVAGGLLQSGINHGKVLQLWQEESHAATRTAVAKCRNDPLVKAALSALNKSYAPYTKSYSGVAVELDDKTIHVGAYAESAAYNPSLSPLQVALVQVLLHSEQLDSIKRVALVEVGSSVVKHYVAAKQMLAHISPRIELTHVEV